MYRRSQAWSSVSRSLGASTLIVALGTLATTDCTNQQGTAEPIAKSQSPIVSADVMGFEVAGTWTTTTVGATLSQSTTHSQGSFSLAVQPSMTNGYTPLTSVPLATLDSVSPSIAFDLMISAQQPNPFWLGTAQMFMSTPSRGVYNAWLGQVELTGQSTTAWNTETFSIPLAQEAALLAGGYADLTFTVVVNVTPGAGTYLVDNLRFVPAASCTGQPNGASCNDGNPATLADTCQLGTCQGINVPSILTTSLQNTASGAAAGEPAGVTPGTIKGTLDVTDDGEAIYRLPLWLPDGRAGVQPNLGLQYRSRGIDGSLGLGWKLDGLSSISRCHQDNAHDVITQPIRFDATDKLCLDGERLILVAGGYNLTGSEYRTEDDKFIKIVQVGADSFGPTGFLAYRPNGMRQSYGNEPSPSVAGYQGDPTAIQGGEQAHVSASDTATTDPTVAYSGTARLSWALASSRDRYNNAVQYSYVTTAQTAANNFTIDFRPASITYTNGPTGPADRSVQFSYIARADVRDAYVSGLPMRHGNLLSAIHVMGPGPTGGSSQSLRTYNLAYQNQAGERALLTGVTECDGKSICKPSTQMTYSPVGLGFTRRDTQNVDVGIVSVDSSTLIPADVDGDGLDDVIYTKKVSSPPNGTQGPAMEWFYNPSSVGSAPELLFAEGLDAQTSTNSTEGFLGAGARGADLDLDGRVDLIAPGQDCFTGPAGAANSQHGSPCYLLEHFPAGGRPTVSSSPRIRTTPRSSAILGANSRPRWRRILRRSTSATSRAMGCPTS